jgi:hypothetical protein
MPVGALCHGFWGNLLGAVYIIKTISYEFLEIICFKKHQKKMTLL